MGLRMVLMYFYSIVDSIKNKNTFEKIILDEFEEVTTNQDKSRQSHDKSRHRHRVDSGGFSVLVVSRVRLFDDLERFMDRNECFVNSVWDFHSILDARMQS